jgi:hypothetical protein
MGNWTDLISVMKFSSNIICVALFFTNVVKRKVSKGHFSPVHIWMGGHASVCLSSLKKNYLIERFIAFSRDHSKFTV